MNETGLILVRIYSRIRKRCYEEGKTDNACTVKFRAHYQIYHILCFMEIKKTSCIK